MPGPSRNVLAFASVVEIGTGLALLVAPAFVIPLLLGAPTFGDETRVAHVAGIALLALGVACWPDLHAAARWPAPLRGMLIYNALVALYFAWLGTRRHIGGPLLWPAAVLHAALAILLLWTGRATKSSTTTP